MNATNCLFCYKPGAPRVEEGEVEGTGSLSV
ncbi:hypothetical protein LCGC14_3013690, partial [marine sediment metagenome]